MTNDLYLQHHGILGQKWGVRRYQNPDGSLTAAGQRRYSDSTSLKSRNGDTINLNKIKSRVKDDKDSSYHAFVNGKKVGDLYLEDEGDSLYINWIGIKNKERGKGYANALMDYTLKYAKENGYKYATLEVPGVSPDARHIYEKKGFQVDNSKSRYDEKASDDVWDGLTSMKKVL